MDCQTDIDECASAPCTGPCTDQVNGYVCAPSPCASNPCSNGGTCVDQSDRFASRFSCQCTAAFTGPLCQTWRDPCTYQQCFFGRVCVSTPNTANYVCECNVAECGARTTSEGDRIAGTFPLPLTCLFCRLLLKSFALLSALMASVPKAILSLSPTSSPALGGTIMTLTTQGFTGTATVQFGSRPANGTATTAKPHSPHILSTFGGVTLTEPVAVNISADPAAAFYLRQLRISFVSQPYSITRSAYRCVMFVRCVWSMLF